MCDERGSHRGDVFMCSAYEFQYPAEDCCYSRIYFIDICIRHRARQVIKNLGGWKYDTSLNTDRKVLAFQMCSG